jgi:cytochrome c-type biogenesis protein CcmE
MKAKHQRLILAMFAVVAIGGSSVLAMSALKDQASYFYAPADLAKNKVAPGRDIRLGGMVKTGSLKRNADGVTINFVLTDGAADTPVVYTGIVPALFREGSGAVADGKLRLDGVFAANRDGILAKHDENYKPPAADGAQHMTKSLQP